MPASSLSPPALRVLQLVRRDRRAAAEAMGALPLEEQVALVCEAPLGRRAELIGIAPSPEALVPRLPEAELCFVLKSLGLQDCGWLLDLATPEQLCAAVDLDVWRGNELDRGRLEEWFAALAEASDDTLLRAAQSLDPELLVLHLRSRLQVLMKPSDSEDPGWEPPSGSQTLEGQFYFALLGSSDDGEGTLMLLRALFERDYWTYFRFMQGAIWELDGENEEWALRWRTGRLQDLGFPDWDEAMAIYRFLPPEERALIPPGEKPLQVPGFELAVWMPGLPEAGEGRLPLFRALAQLSEEERRGAFFALVSLANRIAVADRMELSDAESTPRAIGKAARFASEGLCLVCRENEISEVEALRRVSIQRLFQVGVNLDPAAARPDEAPASASAQANSD